MKGELSRKDVLYIWNMEDDTVKIAAEDDPGIQKLAEYMGVTPKEFLESQLRAWKMIEYLYSDAEG